MRITKIALLLMVLLVPYSMQAQKKKARKKARAVVVLPPEPEEDPRITEMRENTQQIVFIDSMVVDKTKFLSRIHLNTESGKLLTFDEFFRTQNHPDGYVFLNEMGNKCYYSEQNNEKLMRLYTLDKLGNEWSDPIELKGLDEGLTETNYPFMMVDGTTLYFAAKGEESIGGYDIFFTRYDAVDGKFLKPENIGMPFNSEANDYMYCIDEMSNIGYFVTDRRQPEDKVCVYIFIPPTSRRTYQTEAYSEQQLRDLADISRISDTWGSEDERKQALERYQNIGRMIGSAKNRPDIEFIVNDQVTYTSLSQFKEPESLRQFIELQNAKKQLNDIRTQLQQSRNYYAKANAEDKAALQQELLSTERRYERLTAEVKALEKQIRNAENKAINPSLNQ